MAHVYMLRCADGSYYVGSTRTLDARLEQHFSGRGSSYTSTRMPVTLVFAEEYARIDEAYAREKQIQGWGRAKREALIAASFASLPALSHAARQPDTRRPNPLVKPVAPAPLVEPVETAPDFDKLNQREDSLKQRGRD